MYAVFDDLEVDGTLICQARDLATCDQSYAALVTRDL